MIIIYTFYKIVNNNNNKIVYIGCTTQKLNTRFAQHNRDHNSAVYQKYILNGITNLSIYPINIKFKNTLSHFDALRYEETFTYIYGSIYELANFNAGNSYFNKIDLDKFYSCTMSFISDILEQEITLQTKDYKELISCIRHFFVIDEEFAEPYAELNYIYDLICEKIIEE